MLPPKHITTLSTLKINDEIFFGRRSFSPAFDLRNRFFMLFVSIISFYYIFVFKTARPLKKEAAPPHFDRTGTLGACGIIECTYDVCSIEVRPPFPFHSFGKRLMKLLLLVLRVDVTF